jgi:hypothetical protein
VQGTGVTILATIVLHSLDQEFDEILAQVRLAYLLENESHRGVHRIREERTRFQAALADERLEVLRDGAELLLAQGIV